MISLQIAAMSGSHPSTVITEMLGVAAVCAFFVIACYIGIQVVRASSTGRMASSDKGELDRLVQQKIAVEKEQKGAAAADALRKAEAELENRYNKILETGTSKMGELTKWAEECFGRIASSYAANSYGHEGENREVRKRKFASVCERQWGFMRSEIGYLSYLDIQEHLRHILDNHRLLDSHKSPGKSEAADLSPELLRSQEMVALMRVVSRDRVPSLQGDLLDAVHEFGVNYERGTKAWVNDQVVKLTKDIRKKDPNGILLSDTEFFDRYKQLRTRLEIVARLADRIVQNTQQIGEASVALSQVIYVGTVLRILGSMPEWLSEFGLTTTELEETSVA